MLIRRSLGLAFTAALVAFASSALAQEEARPLPKKMADKVDETLVKMAPQRGWLEAHKQENPFTLLGGPIEVSIEAPEQEVRLALPVPRRLDPAVMGTPQYPRSFAGTPLVNGVPMGLRGEKDIQDTEPGATQGEVLETVEQGREYTETTVNTPTGDTRTTVLPAGTLRLQALDATPTDALKTRDRVDFEASWQDDQGNVYSVTCCTKMMAHGVEYPTFGGVVTNHILHGFTRLATAMMPTEFAYFAFWGTGDLYKNGEITDPDRGVHVMLTEDVRTEPDYVMAFDEEVDPTELMVHVMVFGAVPGETEGEPHYEMNPAKTGYTLPNGKDLGYWHVMFDRFDAKANRVETEMAVGMPAE